MSLGPLMIDLSGPTIEPEEREWLATPAVGGVILFTRNYESPQQIADLVAQIHAVRSPSLLVAVDQEGGRVQRFRTPFTLLPAMRCLGRLYDEKPEQACAAAKAFGWVMAAELRAVGIDLSFAPVVDLDLGLAAVIGDRALHSKSNIVSVLAAEFSRGAREAGMSVVAKHFPTHAGAINDSHTSSATDTRKYSQLWDDIHPYRHLISLGLEGVMIGHVIFPEMDPLPASFSSWWIMQELRGQLGFQGAVVSDDVSMEAAVEGGSCAERAIKSLEAGCDMVLVCNAKKEIPLVINALKKFSSPSSQLRLIRLRGRKDQDWKMLRSSLKWKKLQAQIRQLDAQPELELKE
tara:strand:- start:537 stop:1580 length:1044 start_codon:yes stop_codon:yes gene_type:complete